MGRKAHPRQSKVCPQCHAVFVVGGATNPTNKIYCSRTCFLSAIKIAPELRQCRWCLQLFMTERTTQQLQTRIFCSDTCSKNGRNRNGGRAKGFQMSDAAKQKIALASMGNKRGVGHGASPGYKHTLEWRKMMSDRFKGQAAPGYIDGRGIERKRQRDQARQDLPYKLWREAVFIRDDYTCQLCGIRGVRLHADHIKPWSLYPELRYVIDNGRTLCVPCHMTCDTHGAKIRRNPRV